MTLFTSKVMEALTRLLLCVAIVSLSVATTESSSTFSKFGVGKNMRNNDGKQAREAIGSQPVSFLKPDPTLTLEDREKRSKLYHEPSSKDSFASTSHTPIAQNKKTMRSFGTCTSVG